MASIPVDGRLRAGRSKLATVDLPTSAVTDGSQSGATSDDVVHVSKYLNLVPGTYATQTAAVQAAHDALPSFGGTLQFPGYGKSVPITLNSVIVSKNAKIKGVANRTWFVPGASGQIFVVHGGSIGQLLAFEDICWGDPSGTLNFDYRTAMIEVQAFSALLTFRGCYGRLAGTGTLLRLNTAFNVIFRDSYLNCGKWGLPLLIDDAFGASQADTIKIDGVLITGWHGPIVRMPNGTPIYAFRTDEMKQATGGPIPPAILDHSLSASAAAGAISVTLQVGQGASWAIDDPIYIEGDSTADATVRTGATAEINRVTNVATDTLTLAQPLAFTHDPTSKTVQVLRGGVGLSLPNVGQMLTSESSHIEGIGWGIIMPKVFVYKIDHLTASVDRLLRITGGLQYLDLGVVLDAGKSGNSVLIDIPTWNTETLFYLAFRGPVYGSSLTVLDQGVSRAWDSTTLGSVFQNTSYILENVNSDAGVGNGAVVRTWHAKASQSAAIAERYGFGATVDMLHIGYNGQIVSKSGIAFHRNAQAGNYTALPTDCIIGCTGTATTAQTITLPLASTLPAGAVFIVMDEGGLAGTNHITLSCNAADTVAQGAGTTFYTLGTNWTNKKVYTDGVSKWFPI